MVLPLVAVACGWEAMWWILRIQKRNELYKKALAHARRDGVPLIVVGAPDGGVTPGPGCGDVCIDISGCACPAQLKADITKPLPFADGSAVIFVSCVLEYVDNFDAAMRELNRVSGGRLYITRVEPWTFAAYLYPGAKRTLPANLETPQG